LIIQFAQRSGLAADQPDVAQPDLKEVSDISGHVSNRSRRAYSALSQVNLSMNFGSFDGRDWRGRARREIAEKKAS
jgi:hypothetical protein